MAHPPRLVTAGLFACYFFLFLTVPTANANKCTVGCHGMHSDASYKEGQTYTYTLEGTSVTSVSEGQGEATLKLKADVELAVKPDCIRQIRLKNVQVNGAAITQQDLEKHALQFNYHHGHIDSELCAEPADSQASLNIKRAVISLFQSSVLQEEGSTSRHEIDVLGGCVTDFNFSKEGDIQVVNKYRDLNHCSNRENIKQGLFSGITNQNAGLQSLPIINAHQKTEQRFKNGVLDKAVSTEIYRLRPFSNGDAGAKTVVETILTFKGQKGDSPTAPVSIPKSLIFEAPHTVVKSSVESIEKALQAIHKDDHESVKPDEARKFSELIRVLRTSSKKDILTVYHRIKAGAGFDKERDKKALLDALYRTGTGEAAEVVVELIKNKEITPLQALLYYGSLAFIQHVNLPSVTAISTLLDQPNLSRIGYLGIGQIIGRFCLQHSCDNVPEVKSAIEKIAAKVKDGKASSRQEEDIIIAALKALGNSKYLDEGTQTKLANIVNDKKVRNRVRVAAIEALPAKCAMGWKNTIAKSFTDQEEDSEIRIKIYQSYIACPCNKVVGIVKDTLDKEKIYQVGSYIQSHLRNLRATADPSKQNAKAYFGQIRPRTKFPEDFRKFSANDEVSYDINAFGFASTAESNVIFSQNSFVPRSASLNLTTELFGHQFNFLELNTRAENLDRTIEHFFGPKGVVPSQKTANVVRDGIVELTGLSKYIKERFEKSARGKREVKPADVEKFAKGVVLRTKEVDEDLDLDLSIKLFGVELAFLSYGAAGQKYTAQQVVDQIFAQFDQGVNKLKNLNYDIENHVHFLDAEFVYPTGLGLALNLGITGSSVVRSKTHSKIDIPALISDPKNAAVKIAVEPSASIEFVGDLTVTDGFGTETGLRILTTLHTATGFDLNVKVLDGKGVDINLGVPKRKQEIIRISSDVLYTNGKADKYTPIKFTKGVERADCFEQFNAPLGLTVCGHLSYPYDNFAAMQKKPFYPLNGPFQFFISIENNDVNSYHLKALYNKDISNHDYSFEFLLETPNSRTNRFVKLAGQATLVPEPKARIEFDSPIKKASAEALVKRNAKEHSFSVTVKNDNTEYFARAGVESIGGNKYKPVLEYKVPEQLQKLAGKGAPSTEVKGTVEVADHDGGKKYVFNDVQLLASGHKILGIDGRAASTPKALDVDLNLSYAEDKLGIKIDGKKLAPKHYTLTGSIVPSKNPGASLGVDWELNIQKSTIDHKLSVTQGADLKSETDRLKLDQHAEFDSNPEKFILAVKNKLTYPRVGLVAELDGEVTKKTLKYDAELNYGKSKFGSKLDAKINQNKPGDYGIDFEAQVLENKFELDSKRTVVDEFKSKYENSVKITPGGTYKADADVKWQVKKNDIDVDVDAELNFNNKKLKLDSGLIAKPDKIDNHVQLLANGVKYVDYNLKLNRGATNNGNLVFNLKNYLLANGQFTYQGGKGNGNLNIDIPKINRKIKGTGDVTVSGSKHAANFELAYDAEKDPSKKIKLSTVTDFTKSSIDSKNTIDILTYKTEVNFKGKHSGTFYNGQQELETEVTLPNGRYVTFKGNRATNKKDEKVDVDVHFELADHITKGGETKKIIGNAKGTVFSMKNYLYDLAYELKYVHNDGKDLSTKLALKNIAQPNSDKKTAAVDLTAAGSLISTTHNIQGTVDYDPEHVAFKGSASRGNDLSVKSNFNFARGNHVDKPYNLKGVIEAKLPSDKLKNIKFEIEESVLDQKDDDGVFEYTKSKTLTYNDNKKIKFDSKYKHSGNRNLNDLGRFKRSYTAALKVLDKPELSISEEYDHDLTADTKKAHEKGSVKFGDKEVTGDIQAQWSPEFNKIGVNGKFTTPFDKLKSIDVQLNHKHDDKTRKTDVTATIDGVKYTQSTEIVLEGNPGIHLIFTCPAGTTELLAKFKTLGENEYTGEYKLSTPKGFIVVDGHVKLESVDDFVVTVNFDSDKFKYRKVHAKIANEPNAQDGRKIVITVTSEGKNLVTGSTNYKRHEEDKKVTLEGNGSLQIGENTRSSSFKYVRKQLTKDADKEVGVAIMLNASFGPSAIVGEVKLSDKEVHVFNSYCEQSKDCANFKLHSTLDTDHVSHLNHNLQVEVNLKKFNVPVEFGIQASTKYADFSFDHLVNLYLHSSKDRTQYTYHVYCNKRESAAVLTLPSRELAIVAFHDLPAIKHSGAYKIDLSLYLDRKNKPTDKTSLVFAGNVNVDKNAVGIKGEGKFVYPTQSKDMVVKGELNVKPGQEHVFDANVDIDLFANKNDKITATAKVIRHEVPKGQNVTVSFGVFSKGQKLDVKSDNHLAVSTTTFDYGSSLSYSDKAQKPRALGAFVLFSLQQIDINVFLPGVQIVKAHADITAGKDHLKYEATSQFLSQDPRSLVIELKDFNSFKLDLGRKGDAKNKLSAHGKFVFGQLAELQAEFFKNGNKNELFHILIHLDENKFMKPDFGYNGQSVKTVVEHIRHEIHERAAELNNIGKTMGNEVAVEFGDLFDHLKKAQPSFKPLVAYYRGELDKLKTEIQADATIKEIQDIFDRTFGSVITAITETAEEFAERFEDLNEQWNEIIHKFEEVAKTIYPSLLQSFENIYRSYENICESWAKLVNAFAEAAIKIINEHQKDIQELVGVVSEFAQDIAKIIFKGATQIEKEIKEFVQLLVQQIRALPVYDMAKNLYREALNYKLPVYIIQPVEEFLSNVKNILPTQELKDFFTTLYSYILKHVKHEKVDDANEVKKIYTQAVNALRSVLALLRHHVTVENLYGIVEAQIPIDIGYLRRIPGLSTIRFSIVKLVVNRELPTLAELYYTYRPALHVEDSIPPAKKYGYFTDGGYISTFDGSQIIFSGSCNYILAQDVIDGNFTVVGEYNNGNLASVTITEPSESITIKNNGQVLVNNKPADYPASTKNLDAYITVPMRRVKSKYGAKLVCSTGTSMACYLRVSGFYHAKLRGLLGDANNEPADDFILPNGKVAATSTDFVNGYKLNPSCGTATTKTAEAARSPVCTKYFAGKSPLNSCFNYVDPKPFRAACDQLVADNVKSGACAIAQTYVTNCLVQNIFVSLPNDCIQCKVGDEIINGGDSFSVKTPKKQADIIFIVEQATDNEKSFKDIIKPIITELRNELKQQGITDVFIGLIGFGEDQKYARQYTSNNNINIEGGDINNMKFTNVHEPSITLQDAKEDKQGHKKVEYLRQRLAVELGTFKLTDAYEAAIKYPYRAAASKAVVGLISSPCEKSPLSPFSLQDYRLLLGRDVYSKMGLTYYHVAPLADLEISDKPAKNVVGYDADQVYSFADSKNKPLKGSSELKGNLQFGQGDACAKFAVSTGGAAFSTHNFLEAKPAQQSQFIKVAARKIAEDLTQVELEQDCVCVAEAGYGFNSQVISRPHCKVTGRTDKRHGA